MLRFAVFTAVLALLASCASGPTPLEQRAASLPSDQRAYLLGTFVVSCEPDGEKCPQRFDMIAANYRSLNSSDWGEIKSTQGTLSARDTTFDFVERGRNEKGYYFCIVLPPGDYAFYNYRLLSFAGGGTDFGPRNSENFSLPFTLKSDEAKHIGRIKVSLLSQKGRSFVQVLESGHLALSSELPDARSAAFEKCPADSRNSRQHYAPLRADSINNRRVQQDQ